MICQYYRLLSIIQIGGNLLFGNSIQRVKLQTQIVSADWAKLFIAAIKQHVDIWNDKNWKSELIDPKLAVINNIVNS